MRRHLDQYHTDINLTRVALDLVPIAGRVLEPCVGRGHIVQALKLYGITDIVTNDIDPQMEADYHEDATDPLAQIWQADYDWILTNVPFNAAHQILPLALSRARVGIAVMVRHSYLEPTKNRAAWLKANAHLMSDMMIFNPRPSFTNDGNTDSVTVDWLVWRHGWPGGCALHFVTGWDKNG